jgi:hypothetical protein
VFGRFSSVVMVSPFSPWAPVSTYGKQRGQPGDEPSKVSPPRQACPSRSTVLLCDERMPGNHDDPRSGRISGGVEAAGIATAFPREN